MRPSPALTSAVPGSRLRRERGDRAVVLVAHDEAVHAHRLEVRIVSRAVSPLLVDEVDASKFSTSAPRRCAASWKLERVRVEGSKNSVHTVRAGQRAAQRDIAAAVVEVLREVEQAHEHVRGRPSSVRKWRRRPCASTWATVTRRLRSVL